MTNFVLYAVLTLGCGLLAREHYRVGRRAKVPALVYLSAVIWLEAFELLALTVYLGAVNFQAIPPGTAWLLVARVVTVLRLGIVAGFLFGARYGVRTLADAKFGDVGPFVLSGYAGLGRSLGRRIARGLRRDARAKAKADEAGKTPPAP